MNKKKTLKKAFALLKIILSDDSFYNSLSGPSVIMTNNCGELYQSLSYNWPDATLLLCIFHILQQVWRWLYESCHSIAKNDRVITIKLFWILVYARHNEDHVSAYTVLFEYNLTNKYSLCVRYFEDLCNSQRWAICFWNEELTRGSNTSYYVQARFLVMKDYLLKKQSQFNINKLFDKVTNKFEDHHKGCLLYVADGTFDRVYSQRFKGTNYKSNAGNAHLLLKSLVKTSFFF